MFYQRSNCALAAQKASVPTRRDTLAAGTSRPRWQRTGSERGRHRHSDAAMNEGLR